MAVGPNATEVAEVACESSSRRFPIRSAACAAEGTGMEWVPDRERALVPPVMAGLCRGCPGRQQCLLWALAGQEQGYWAATTSADRGWMAAHGQTSVHTADRLQESIRRQAGAGARHREGEGSYFWYRRRGCRCGECQGANTAARARERAKARLKSTVAA
jgi:hypothetical protein